MSLYSIALHCHSSLRYVALVLLLMAIFVSLRRLISGPSTTPFSLKIPLFTLITFHLQLLTGLLLYVISPKVQFSSITMKVDIFRFFTMEHSLMMIISITLITVGYSAAKRNKQGTGYKQIFIYYVISLLILLIAIPWPFRQKLGAGWF